MIDLKGPFLYNNADKCGGLTVRRSSEESSLHLCSFAKLYSVVG